MANEKRLDLIDRQALIKAAQKKLFGISDNTHPYKAVEIVGKYFREVVDNAPTVDAVEVVRCKDCKYCTEVGLPRCRITGRNMTDDDFCSRGERREGE